MQNLVGGLDEVLVGGLDEVGWGALAGPILIAVVVFPKHTTRISGVRDSKQLSQPQRQKVLPLILAGARWVGFGFASAQFIDQNSPTAAWQAAASMALHGSPGLEQLIVDGDRAVEEYEGEQVVEPKADINHWVVSAASIVAKELRDLVMRELGESYPHYGFLTNSGYGTSQHTQAIKTHGLTPFHRVSFCQKAMPSVSSKFTSRKIKRRG